MLKKLSKYGNSTTLVIDKAILELLNMSESSIVKLHTDGKSLIITPVEAANSNGKISYEPMEALQAAKEAFVGALPAGNADAVKNQKLQEEFAQVFKKHAEAFNKFNSEIFPSEKFQHALAELNERIDPVKKNEQYLKEFNKLKVQFCPELEDLSKEIDKIYKKSADAK